MAETDTGTLIRVLVIAPFAVSAFAGLWCAIVYCISKLGGWSTLATRYRSDAPFGGRTWPATGMLNHSQYKGTLIVGADSAGVHLSVMFLFRLGHPSLFIPWSDITAGEVSGRFFKTQSLHFSAFPGIVLKLHPDVAGALLSQRPT